MSQALTTPRLKPQPIRQYLIGGALLLIWTVYLSINLPERHTARHWDYLWVGYDIGILLAVSLTIFLLRRRSLKAIISMSALATLLIADAWIDITSAHLGRQLVISCLSALLFEIPIAIIVFRRCADLLASTDRTHS